MHALTSLAFVGSVLVLCSFNGLLTGARATDVTFSNETYTNGTNMVTRFAFTEDYQSGTVNCTFSFPGGNTFLQVAYRTYITSSGSVTFPSDISVRPSFLN
jgi:hypothetical protein